MIPVPGLCRVVTLEEVSQNNHSLTPGRYVGVAQTETEEHTIDHRLKEIHEKISALNEEASALAKTIDTNLKDLIS